MTRKAYPPGFIVPDWPAPSNVNALVTTRAISGASTGCYASFNLAEHVSDSRDAIVANRDYLTGVLGHPPVWLNQTHSTDIVQIGEQNKIGESFDGSYTKSSGVVCAIMTADCLPILLCDSKGEQVACLHVGWRGLANGIIAKGVESFGKSEELIAYLGPAISIEYFEVGEDVVSNFQSAALERGYRAGLDQALIPVNGQPGKYMADLYCIATLELQSLGVQAIYGGGYCTYGQQELFYSFRRDGETGRIASLIWLD